jgi:hypothetical protein
VSALLLLLLLFFFVFFKETLEGHVGRKPKKKKRP